MPNNRYVVRRCCRRRRARDRRRRSSARGHRQPPRLRRRMARPQHGEKGARPRLRRAALRRARSIRVTLSRSSSLARSSPRSASGPRSSSTIPTVALFALVVDCSAYPKRRRLAPPRQLRPRARRLLSDGGRGVRALRPRVDSGHARTRRAASASRRYAHAFVETSLPTAAILYYATIDGPVQALLMPSAFVYFVFILLSTLGSTSPSARSPGSSRRPSTRRSRCSGREPTRARGPSLTSLPHHLGKAVDPPRQRHRGRLRRAAPAEQLHARDRVRRRARSASSACSASTSRPRSSSSSSPARPT